MSEIKVVIQLLCQQLNLLLKTELKPENFRLSKFNNNDESTIRELWTALWNLSKKLGATFPEESGYPTAFKTQVFMMSKKYNCTEFYCLPWDNSSGSRELLLALMWVIASENTLARLIFDYVRQSPLCQEYPECLEKLPSDTSKSIQFLSDDAKCKLNLQDQMQHSLWLASRIKYNLNKIHELNKERIQKTYMIHEATSGASGLPHLSAFETKLVHNPEFLKQHMPGLLLLNELLDVHSKWTKKRSIFWDWMDTVVELKEKEVSVVASLHPQQEKALVKFSESLHSYINSVKSKGTMNIHSTLISIPRFFISSLFMKSSSTLMRKGSSNDLLSEIETSDNGVVMRSSDLLTLVDTNLHESEKQKIEKLNELHGSLHTLSKKLGVIVISDTNNVETESEDCSK